MRPQPPLLCGATMSITSLSPRDREDARLVAAQLRDQWGLDEDLQRFAELAYDTHAADWPHLHLEDVTGIPFLDGVVGIEEYQHRARVRARGQDLFAAGTSPAPGYEDYCQTTLALGAPELVLA